MGIKLCIFDLDDTLISTGVLYESCLNSMCDYLETLGFDSEESYTLNRSIDRNQIQHLGVSLPRFPNSMVMTYTSLCHKYDITILTEVKDELRIIGNSVFSMKANNFHFSEEVLRTLSEDYTLAICTRGDRQVQSSRILHTDLLKYISQVFVTDNKTPDLFTRITQFFNVSVNESVMVGDALAGDILPALEAGLFAIHCSNGTYQLEDPYPISSEDYSRMRVVENITSVHDILTTLEN